MVKYPKIQIVGREYANSQPAAATSAVNTALLKFPDLAGIFAIDGTAGTGAVAALRNANKVGQVKLVGYDAYKAEVDALKEGVFTALIAQQPAKKRSSRCNMPTTSSLERILKRSIKRLSSPTS
jgi:ribose transport system substrate-binding protein